MCTTAPSDDDWQSITEALAPDSRFVTAAWIRAWAQSLLPDRGWHLPLQFWTVRDGDARLRAILPIAVQRKFGIAVAALGGLYWPFRSIVMPDDAVNDAACALAGALTQSARMLVMRCGPVPERCAGTSALMSSLERRGWRIRCAPLGYTFASELPASWSAFEQQPGGRLAKRTAYYERRIGRDGALEIRMFGGAAEASWPDALRDIAAIERNSWQHRAGGVPRFAGARLQAFWTAILADARCARAARAWLMYFDGEPASFCFCLDSGETRYVIANNYAERVRGYSTGSILYRHVFRDAIESAGIRRIDIGLGDSGYKSRWGARPALRLLDWVAFRPGLRGRLLESGYALR